MDNSGQQAFIGRIRSALAKAPGERPLGTEFCASRFTDETRDILERISSRSPSERQQLLARFIEMAAPINLNVVVLKDEPSVAAAIADLVRDKQPEWGDRKTVTAWQHPLIERLNLGEAMADQKVSLVVTQVEDAAGEMASQKTRDRLREQIVDSFIGITAADYGMAETASLVLRTRPGQARSVSLVPSIHIGIIRLEQIIQDLKELFALLSFDPEVRKESLTNCMSIISGPSKTADVEATMVHGAHGPREVYVYVITG